jgi:hypothetical protein
VIDASALVTEDGRSASRADRENRRHDWALGDLVIEPDPAGARRARYAVTTPSTTILLARTGREIARWARPPVPADLALAIQRAVQ